MPRSTAVAAAVVVVLTGLGLAACTAEPPVRQAELDAHSASTTREAAHSATDEWTAHFDDRAAEIDSASGVSWGSFGPKDDVAPVGFTNDSVPPGDHVVTVQCAGPETVLVTLAPAGELPGTTKAHELACPGGGAYAITTSVEGLTLGMDSHGRQGAYLFAIDVEP